MTSGFRSVVLRPFDVFFRRKHAGAVMPVHLMGTYNAPEVGLDLPAKKAAPEKKSPNVSLRRSYFLPRMVRAKAGGYAPLSRTIPLAEQEVPSSCH